MFVMDKTKRWKQLQGVCADILLELRSTEHPTQDHVAWLAELIRDLGIVESCVLDTTDFSGMAYDSCSRLASITRCSVAAQALERSPTFPH